MSLSRRCFLQFCGGAAAGAVLSPLPWKLLDDAAIWTQNWSWIPRTSGGPVSCLHTTCSQCPAACGLRLRLVGGRVVSAWGTVGHPVSDGRLCPLGLGIAQTRFHPARVRGAAARVGGSDQPWRLVDTRQAMAEVGRKVARLRDDGDAQSLAILDLRPGRALSVLYGDFLAAAGGGHYLTWPGGSDQATATLASLVDVQQLADRDFGYDLAGAHTVVSFGATVPGICRSTAQVVHIAPNGSREASLAHTWLPLLPGTEAALALGLAHLLRHQLPAGAALPLPGEGSGSAFWAAYGDLVLAHTPEHVATVTGIACPELQAVAARLTGQGPALVLGGGNLGGGPLGAEEELAIGALNLQIRSLGQAGGLVLRPRLAALFEDQFPHRAVSLEDIPDGALDLLLVDGQRPDTPLPADLLRRKLRGKDSLVVAMSAFATGAAAQADLILPVAAAGEWRDDVPGPALAPQTSYSWAGEFAPPPDWALHPADLLAELAAAAQLPARYGRPRHEEELRRRVTILAGREKGKVFQPAQDAPPTRVADPDRLQQILAKGGCWTEAAAASEAIAVQTNPQGTAAAGRALAAVAGGRLATTADQAGDYPLILVIEGDGVAARGGTLPPVVNKLYRESNLLNSVGQACLNPETARRRGLRAGRTALLTTPDGTGRVTLTLDETVRPGVVRVVPGPSAAELGDPDRPDQDILTICGAGRRPVWRVGRASLREV